MGIFDIFKKKTEAILPVKSVNQYSDATTIGAKYNLIFVKPEGTGRGSIYSANDLHEHDMLMLIGDIHISECERIVEEIDNALQGREYEETPSFDWADLDIALIYPNVELHGEVISMVEFKLLLLEWIDFNRKHNKNIL